MRTFAPPVGADLVCVHLWTVRVQKGFFYFSAWNQSPIINTQTNEQMNTWSTQRAATAFPLAAPQRSPLLPQGHVAPLSLQNSHLHQCHHTKICFAGKLRSRYWSSLPLHKQQTFHLSKKKTTTKTWKNPQKVNHAESCKHLPEVLPLSVWRDSSAVLGRECRQASHTQLTHLPYKLSATAACRYLCSGTVLNIPVPFP